MKELEENNCEVRSVVSLELPAWRPSEKQLQEEAGLFEGAKESGLAESCGGFLNTDCKYAWLSHESRLLVIDVRCGRCVSAWSFPYRISCVAPFPVQAGKVPLLLVGLDNNAVRIKDSVGYLCIFDCCTSTVLTTIQVPAGVEKACVIHGGTDWEEYSEKRPDTVLPKNTGLIFAALRNFQHVIIDVNRDSWANLPYEGNSIMAKLQFVNDNLSCAIPSPKDDKPIHLAYDLMSREIEQYIGFDRKDFEATPLYDESLCSILLSSTKTGCLITGCLGRIIIWQNDGSIGWISPAFDENAYVTHIALLEPSDDPRPFYYLWIVCQSDSPDSSAVLRMYAMLFNRKLSNKSTDGSSLYYNLESEPSLKFELELERAERVHSLLAVERENPRDASDANSRKGEDSLLLIGTDERVLLFDLNRWYKEQMPRTMAECRNPNSVMSSYRTRQDDVPRKGLVGCCYVPRSLREFPNKGPSSPEELFYPNSLTLEWVEFLEDSLVFWIARGVQSELLRDIAMNGPIVLIKPTETYRRCLIAGLVPFDSVPQDYVFEAKEPEAREMLLSLCLEQRWASFLLRCATEWSDGSAAYIYPEFLCWGVQRASEIKLIADRLCVPLFDQSGVNIGEAEVKTLRFCCQQLECLATVVSKLPNINADLAKQRRALQRIATYLQVLLWFYDVGLLPETQQMEEEDDVSMTLSRKIPYPRDKLIESFKRKRRNDGVEENKEDNTLYIDQLITRECRLLKAQWERESDNDCPNKSGLYPPPSLQSLLRSFLTDCYQEDETEDDEDDDLPEIASKHSITIYMLMDLAMLLQDSHSGVDRLIKYPSAFKLSPSLIKLTQAFWLLDHEDYDRFFKIITGQLISTCDIKDWQHELAINALLKNDQHKMALVYLRVMKPPLSSQDDQSMMIDLEVEQGHVETAFHARPPSHYGLLLTRFFQACKNHNKLKEILHLSLDPEEEEVFVKFLKDSDCQETRLIYYLQRSKHTEASDIFSINTNVHPRLSMGMKKIQPAALKMLSAFNATLPETTKRFASSLCKSANAFASGQPSSMMSGNNEPRGYYPRPMSQCRDKASELYELAISKARETCLRPERSGPGISNYVPFLGAPCSTINFGLRFAGQTSEPTDANCVTYPEKKMFTSKRSLRMMNGGEDEVDNDRKKRKLNDEESFQGADLSAGDDDPQKFRRLSMSQVCNTPLVQRKVQPVDAGEPNGLIPETPHSILKIRQQQQMLRRDSRSPSYDYGDPNNEANILGLTVTSDLRPMRQIRFSVDRFSGTDDSGLSGNDTTRNDGDSNNTNSSKNTGEESCAEENYYSPNTSNKSLRDSTILSDTSMTKYLGGPRPRPSLRKSGASSYGSSDDLSHKSCSLNETSLNASVPNISCEIKKTPRRASSICRRKSALSPNIYSKTILSPNSSAEASPLKGPLTLYNNERDEDKESEESEDESEEETNVMPKFTDVESDSSTEPLPASGENKEKEKQNSPDDWEMEIQQEEEERKEEQGRLPSVNNDVLEDDEIVKVDEKAEQPKESEEELEEGEIDEADETFQSISNSLNENALETTTSVSRSEDGINQEEKHSETKEIDNLRKGHSIYDYSITQKFALDREEYDDQTTNYSLTKPIFIDSGIVNFRDDVYNITDDESINEADVVRPPRLRLIQAEENDQAEEDETVENMVLSFSHSDGSDEDKKRSKSKSPQKKKKDEWQSPEVEEKVENRLEKETRSFVSEELNSSPKSSMSRKDQTALEFDKETSVNPQSRQSSISSTKIDHVEDKDKSQKCSSRHEEIRRVSPRSSIKTTSLSPASKTQESKSPIVTDRKNRSMSLPKKVKKILIKSSDTPSMCLEGVLTPPSNDDEDSMQEPHKLSVPLNPFVEPLEESVSEETSSKSSSPRSTQVSHNKESRTEKKSAAESEKPSKNRSARGKSAEKEAIPTKEVKKSTRKTRSGSISKESIVESSDKEEQTIDEHDEKKSPRTRSMKISPMANKSSVATKELNMTTGRKTKAGSVAEEQDSQEEQVSSISKKTRAGSVAKEVKEPVVSNRKTRAASVAKDEDLPSANTRKKRAGSMAKDEDLSIFGIRKTRAGSVVNEEDQPATVARRTRAGSVVNDEEQSTARKTRAGSVQKEDDHPASIARKTRGGSVAKEEKSLVGRKTRASSLAKETSEEDTRPLTPEKRSTRVSSVAKDSVAEEQDETSKRPTRRRGSSMPKEVPSILEPGRLLTRGRRSTSLLKEVILEESMSAIDSPASAKRGRTSTRAVEALPSSPAANTRSRRSSIQSVPDELEEILSVPSIAKKTSSAASKAEAARNRRATSVDSGVVGVLAGKRVTRGLLAKTIVEQVIPEESTPVTKKQPPGRRKRGTSVNEEEHEETKDKAKAPGKPKRGRKASESKDYLFSMPEQPDEELPVSSERDCRTPTFEFSEPTGLQKFITPIRYDECSEETTNLLKPREKDNEDSGLARFHQRPRTCFVMPKNTKDKAK